MRERKIPNMNSGSSGKQKKSKRSEWDSTLTDLSVYRLSDRDLNARRQMFISKNLETARKELYEKPKVTVGKKKPLIGGQLQLHEVLNEAEESLAAAVQGICEDYPRRYSANPNVTVAPHIFSNKENLQRAMQESIVGGEHPTAVMSPAGVRHDGLTNMVPPITAINELGEERYQPSIDMEHFHSVLERVSPVKEKGEGEVEPNGVEHMLEEELMSCADILVDETHQGGTQLFSFDENQPPGGKKWSVANSLIVLLRLLKKSHLMVKEMKDNNCNLIETVTEQQTVIDMLAQDILMLKQQNAELQATITQKCECLEVKIKEAQQIPLPSHPIQFIPHPLNVGHAPPPPPPPGYCIVPPPYTVTSRDNELLKNNNKSVSFAPLPIFNTSND